MHLQVSGNSRTYSPVLIRSSGASSLPRIVARSSEVDAKPSMFLRVSCFTKKLEQERVVSDIYSRMRLFLIAEPISPAGTTIGQIGLKVPRAPRNVIPQRNAIHINGECEHAQVSARPNTLPYSTRRLTEPPTTPTFPVSTITSRRVDRANKIIRDRYRYDY